MRMFHGDLRLVAAAYYAPEQIVARRGLNYRNPDVIAYVRRLRVKYITALGEEPVLEAMATPESN